MKTNLTLIALLALLIAGCQSTPQRIAFNSLATVAQSVDAAMETAGALYRAGELSDSDKESILKKYEKYQAAANSALLLLEFDYEAIAPEDVTNLANILIETVIKISERNP